MNSYKVLTVETTPWGTVQAPIVVLDGWSFSTSSLCGFMSSKSVRDADDGMHTVSCREVNGSSYDEIVNAKPHPLNGAKFATAEAAEQAAYEAGVLGYFVRGVAS